MAQWDFSLGANGTGHLTVTENWNASTQVSLHVRLWVNKTGDWYSSTVATTWNGDIGGVTGSNRWSYTAGSNTYTLWEFDYTFNKDANGNVNIGCYGYINGDNAGKVGAGSTSQTYTPARVGVAPGGRNKSVDTITNTTARFGRINTDNGLGTSSANRVYYRLGNSGGWTWQTADQGGTGWKYNSVTGLTPNTTYSYFSRHWNNNGDQADTGSSTFKTLASGGITSVTGIKSNKATIAVGMNASGTAEENATVKIQYKRTADVTWIDSSTSTSLTPSFILTGLKPNTNYQYRIVATNSTGTWTGDAATFKTDNPPGFVFILGDI